MPVKPARAYSTKHYGLSVSGNRKGYKGPQQLVLNCVYGLLKTRFRIWTKTNGEAHELLPVAAFSVVGSYVVAL